MENTRDLLSLEHDTNDDSARLLQIVRTFERRRKQRCREHWPEARRNYRRSGDTLRSSGFCTRRQFSLTDICSDVARTNHVPSALDEDGVKSVRDLIGANVKYEDIKERLVNTYSVSQSTRFREIAKSSGLGDRRPS